MVQKLDIQVYHECMGMHDHTYPQILVPLQDTMTISIGETDYQVTPQELSFVPAGMAHQCNYRGKLLVINLVGELTEKQDMVLLSYPLIVSMKGQIIQLVELIQQELKQNPQSKTVRYLYSYLYGKLIENCAAPSIRYIAEHYDMPITVNQLAEIENYNATYYSDWFKQQTGVSPSMYLRYIRINRAKELLEETDYTVMDIAVMVGYSSNSTFTRAFHSVAGMTPKEYREEICLKRAM